MKREALTIRFPAELLQKIRALKREDESLNDLIVQALEKEMKWRSAWAAHALTTSILKPYDSTLGNWLSNMECPRCMMPFS